MLTDADREWVPVVEGWRVLARDTMGQRDVLRRELVVMVATLRAFFADAATTDDLWDAMRSAEGTLDEVPFERGGS
jgi:hypothetical protein